MHSMRALPQQNLNDGSNAWSQVLIDINWRPVFFEEDEGAKEVIFPYVQKADILKMSDEEAEWLYSIPRDTALHKPDTVSHRFECTPPGTILRVSSGPLYSHTTCHTPCRSESRLRPNLVHARTCP